MPVLEETLEDGTPVGYRLNSFSASLLVAEGVGGIELQRTAVLAVRAPLDDASSRLPSLAPRMPDDITASGGGNFHTGGPEGDNGLSGKKLVMDAYGPRVPIGSGAWSGKDFYKVERAGGILARRIAKLVVRLGIAREATVTLVWQPGETFAPMASATGTTGQVLDVTRLGTVFDLGVEAMGAQAAQLRLQDIARWGHFSPLPN